VKAAAERLFGKKDFLVVARGMDDTENFYVVPPDAVENQIASKRLAPDQRSHMSGKKGKCPRHEGKRFAILTKFLDEALGTNVIFSANPAAYFYKIGLCGRRVENLHARFLA